MPNATPYIICSPLRGDLIELAHGSPGVRHIDPWLVANEAFIAHTNRLARRWSPDASLALPAWALYDCAEASGAVIGLEEREGSSGGPEPVTMLAAMPTLRDDEWHCLALRGPSERLARTLDEASGLLGMRTVTSVVAWDDPVLGVLAAGRTPQVLTAWTPAHPEASATIRLDSGTPRPENTQPDRLRLDPADHAAMQRVQSLIESGRRVWIASVHQIPRRDGEGDSARAGGAGGITLEVEAP
jgi:hypothetical protein